MLFNQRILDTNTAINGWHMGNTLRTNTIESIIKPIKPWYQPTVAFGDLKFSTVYKKQCSNATKTGLDCLGSL